jgi:hypothetical protein
MPSLHRSPPVGSAIARDRYPRGLGDVAQLVEHLLCKQGVGGSSPLVSTTAGQRPWPSSSSAVAGTIGRAPTGWNGSRSAGRSTLLRDFLASVGYRGRDGLSPRLCEEGKVRGPLCERTSRRDGKRNHLFAVYGATQDGEGVRGISTTGVGVHAESGGPGTALQVTGPATFSQTGVATVPAARQRSRFR